MATMVALGTNIYDVGGGYTGLSNDGNIYNANSIWYGNDNAGTDFTSLACTPTGGGYWMLRSNGDVYAPTNSNGGDAVWHGNATPGGGYHAVSIAAWTGAGRTASTQGYWILDDGGTVYGFGAAAGVNINVGILYSSGDRALAVIPTAASNGWWVITQKGYVYNYNSAPANRLLASTNFTAACRGPANLPGVTGISRNAGFDGFYAFEANGTIHQFPPAGLDSVYNPPAFSSAPVFLSGAQPTADGGGIVAVDIGGAIYNAGDSQYQGNFAGFT